MSASPPKPLAAPDDPVNLRIERPWALPAEEVTEELGTPISDGLSAAEAARRLERVGANEMTVMDTQPAWRRLLEQFHAPLIYILLAAVVVTLALGEWVDAGVILAVVLVNAVVGFVEETRAQAALDALARALSPEAVVVRDGDERRIDARHLVPGDVVLLRPGDKVPADLRLVESRNLRVDESTLTGEAAPVGKSTEPVDEQTVLGDRTSMAYSSTVVTFGQGRGVVVATGDHTELGRVSKLLAGVQAIETPLTRKIAQFSKVLVAVVLILALVTFLVGALRGTDRSDAFMAAVALTVAAIPEGLPAAMTIVLAIGVARMARRRAIIRKLPAVETLGSTTVVCSDKTGTLTANEMTVTTIGAGGRFVGVTGTGFDPVGELLGAQGDIAVLETLRCGVLCNDARIVEDESSGWACEGDPTEGALVVSGHKAGLHLDGEQVARPRLDTIPFASEHRFMATLHRDESSPTGRVVYLKGSVEDVLLRCDHSLDARGGAAPLDVEGIRAASDALAAQGLRVLAFARLHPPAEIDEIDHDDVAGGLTFLGVQGMIDPPRPEAAEAVEACRTAGISVRMITGDHPGTARAVAAQLGIINPAGEVVTVTGAELADMDDQQLVDAAVGSAVFARVSPEQKLRLVEALQQQGGIVAMTGDGVNDAPALKQADIGVAMGEKGTDAAKDAADMILTDDNFATIRAAIEEGRGTFDNLIKFIVWTLPTNLGEALVVLVAVILGGALPITPVQILWINMSTALLLGLMLAFEPKEPGIMNRPPRPPNAPILSAEISLRILLVGGLLVAAAFGLFAFERAQGADLVEAQTVALTTFVMIELAYLFNCRSLVQPLRRIGWFTNPWVWWGAGAMVVVQLMVIHLPPLQRVFGTIGIGLASWGRIVALSVGTYLIVSAVTAVLHRRDRRAAPSSARPRVA